MSISAIVNAKELTFHVNNTNSKKHKVEDSKQRKKSKPKVSSIASRYEKTGKNRVLVFSFRKTNELWSLQRQPRLHVYKQK